MVVSEDRDRAYDGSSEVDNLHSERTQIMVPLLTLDVRFTERFGVQAAASVPDVARSAAIVRPSGTFNFSETFSGLGDTSIVGWYKLAPINGWYPVVNFGTSLPTGGRKRRVSGPNSRTGVSSRCHDCGEGREPPIPCSVRTSAVDSAR